MGEAIVKFYREPEDSRDAGSDGIQCTLEIIDHEGKMIKVEVSLHQDGDNVPIFSYCIQQSGTDQKVFKLIAADDVSIE